MRFSEVIHVRPPIEAVVDAWARQDRAAEYAPGVLQRSVVGDGPIGRGSRIAAIDRWPGFEVSHAIEIAVLEPHRVAAILSEPLSGGWDAIFDVVDGRTEMRLEGTLNPGGAPRAGRAALAALAPAALASDDGWLCRVGRDWGLDEAWPGGGRVEAAAASIMGLSVARLSPSQTGPGPFGSRRATLAQRELAPEPLGA